MTKEEREQLKELMVHLKAQDETMTELKAILPTLKRMADAWESAGWFGRAIKWVAGVVGAFAVIAAAIRYGVFK